jgi:hypothetical protein
VSPPLRRPRWGAANHEKAVNNQIGIDTLQASAFTNGVAFEVVIF